MTLPAAETGLYAEAVQIVAQFGGYASRSTLQRRLRIGYQTASAFQDRLLADGHLTDARALAAEHAGHRTRALRAYAEATAGVAVYEASGVHGIPLNSWSSYQDAAQVARGAFEAARFYGATPGETGAPVSNSNRGTDMTSPAVPESGTVRETASALKDALRRLTDADEAAERGEPAAAVDRLTGEQG